MIGKETLEEWKAGAERRCALYAEMVCDDPDKPDTSSTAMRRCLECEGTGRVASEPAEADYKCLTCFSRVRNTTEVEWYRGVPWHLGCRTYSPYHGLQLEWREGAKRNESPADCEGG